MNSSKIKISLIIFMVLFLIIGITLIIVFVDKQNQNKTGSSECTFTELDPPVITAAKKSIVGPFSSNVGFGKSISGDLELTRLVVGSPESGTALNIGEVYYYLSSDDDDSGFENTLIIQPNSITQDFFGTIVKLSPDSKWLIICSLTNTGLYIVSMDTVVPKDNIVTVNEHVDIPEIKDNLFSNPIFVSVNGSTLESDNIFVKSTNDIQTVYQFRKFGVSPDFTWNYQVSMLPDNIPVYGSNKTSQMLLQGTTSVISSSLNISSNPSSSLWVDDELNINPPSSMNTWGDVISIGNCGLFGVIHGLTSTNEDIVYIMHRTSTNDAWTLSVDPLTSETNKGFGTSMACSTMGAYVVIAEPQADYKTFTNHGRVFIYTRSGNTLGSPVEIIPISNSHNDLNFGTQVLISQNEDAEMTVIVSGPNGSSSFPGILCTYKLNS
jgi:hypothetical protein